jgi:hypothetical protein
MRHHALSHDVEAAIESEAQSRLGLGRGDRISRFSRA